jgi:hypothetical protein
MKGTFKNLTSLTSGAIEENFIGPGLFPSAEKLVEYSTKVVLDFIEGLHHDAAIKVRGPTKLVTYSPEKDKYRKLAFLGGETLHFNRCRLGKRDGLLYVFTSDEIPGLGADEVEFGLRKAEQRDAVGIFSPETTELSFGEHLIDTIGDIDVIVYAAEAAIAEERLKEKLRLEALKARKELYGTGYGSWS